MEILLEKLGKRLREWSPETATQIRQDVTEIRAMSRFTVAGTGQGSRMIL